MNMENKVFVQMIEDKVVAQMFDFGPLHESRYEIMEKLKNIKLQTGDILYRASNALGPLGIPFSRLVARATKSIYSHAAIVLMMNGNEYVLEINDQGTLLYRMIDWLDTCYTKEFSIYRLKEFDDTLISKIEEQIQKVLQDDPDYDFTFSDPDKFYCTESVAVIYQRVGIQLVEPDKIKDIVPTYIYYILRIGSWISGCISNATLPFNVGVYYVGNSEKGMMSSDKTVCIYKH